MAKSIYVTISVGKLALKRSICHDFCDSDVPEVHVNYYYRTNFSHGLCEFQGGEIIFYRSAMRYNHVWPSSHHIHIQLTASALFDPHLRDQDMAFACKL